MAQNNSSFDSLPEEDIKNYQIMIEYFGLIGSECLNLEDEQDLDSDLKWIKFSDLFKAFGFDLKVFTANKCRARFYKLSALYAKNYDKYYEKLESKYQKTFDSLKIVHILDFNKFWIFDNSTHILLRDISLKPEIKDYVKRKRIELNSNKKKDEIRAKWKALNQKSANISTFEGMDLKDDLILGIRALKYKEPSVVQQRAIVACIIGRDVIAQAQSGTGKTAAFAIAILQTIDISIDKCQALVLAPTRELARQIYKDISQLGKYMTVRTYLSIGGTSIPNDMSRLISGQHVVVGTPGRVLDMTKRGALATDCMKILVLDECDHLLDLDLKVGSKRAESLKSFKKQISDIFERLNPSIQVFLSSATMPPEIASMTQSFMKNPLQILVKNDELTLRSLKQYFVNSGQEGFKFDTFYDVFERIVGHHSFKSGTGQIFVYCNLKRTVDWLVNLLETKNIIVSHMHGATNPYERESILNEFRSGRSRVIITTDLLGRGIDVIEAEFVINYNLPQNRETYMHRVGRSGRFAGLYGHTGKAITFVTDSQMEELTQIQSFYHTQIEELPDDISCLF